MKCEHDYSPWAWPIGTLKTRQCRRCGYIETWGEYLRRIKAVAAVPGEGQTGDSAKMPPGGTTAGREVIE